MLFFFELNNKKLFWPHKVMLLILVLQCAIAILFKGGLTIKLFAALTLLTTLVVEVVVSKSKKLSRV